MIEIDKKLIEKYRMAGPRYTSYPPVPFWESKGFFEEDWFLDLCKHLRPMQNIESPIADGVDLYVHIPFCEELCYYCGCNRIATKNHSIEDHFVELVVKEFNLYKKRFGNELVVSSIHLGGGTPTFLSPKNIQKLLENLLENVREKFIGAVEIDPRTCKEEHLKVFSKFKINRISLGIQDFSSEVQYAVNRFQSFDLVKDLVNKIRKIGFSSINFDLIYGLPKQNKESIINTIDSVIALRPDSIAFYNYAHLPDKIKNQKLIKEHDLPSPELKYDLFLLGKKMLLDFGYEEIGLDHFSRPGHFLSESKKNKTLLRNFMGHTDQKSKILLGLGPSAISDSGFSFIQNSKDLKKYEQSLENQSLPIEIAHKLSNDDLVAQKIILDLMCQNSTSLLRIRLPYLEIIWNELRNLRDDGLIEIDDHLEKISITPLGTNFIRNIVMVFDHRLRESKTITLQKKLAILKSFSHTI